MRIGLEIPDFTWPGGKDCLGSDVARIARAAEAAGFFSICVMDHLFQIEMFGPPEREMLEAYTTLAFIAGHTSRVQLGTTVTCVAYRHPGVLAKTITTLDVLSGGRAWLGIGAGWNASESDGLGIPFPPLGERFERLEETLRICRQMFSGDDTTFEGRHYRLERPLNSPGPIHRPRPPILVGGVGERRTLRLVARYADACNLFPGPDIPHKLDVLRAHCEAEGRDYDEIERTCMYHFDLGERGERAEACVDELRQLAAAGIQTVHGSVANAHRIEPLEMIGEAVIPAVRDL
jgi:F420-dependent oxidoreductase-like protein